MRRDIARTFFSGTSQLDDNLAKAWCEIHVPDGRYPESQIRDLYRIVADLGRRYPGRPFTLDGHLIGSMGEVIAAERFGLTLAPLGTEGYDATNADGQTVEIKTTSGPW